MSRHAPRERLFQYGAAAEMFKKYYF